jgi:hypothetical protein
MTPICESTERNRFPEIRGNTAENAGQGVATGGRQVYERIREILRYDVRSIGSPSQAWFWTQGWQECEREADADIAAGRTTVFRSGDDLLAHIDPADPD